MNNEFGKKKILILTERIFFNSYKDQNNFIES